MTEQTYKVGDVAYVDESRYGEAEVFQGEVIRVTPTGQIVVQSRSLEYRFDKRGREVGDRRYHRRHLITKTAYDALALDMQARRDRRQAATHLEQARAFIHNQYDKADILAQIDAARALVEKLP